ncbi:MAG: hypothetical protein AAGE52_36840 [Myxococcota bacterium]
MTRFLGLVALLVACGADVESEPSEPTPSVPPSSALPSSPPSSPSLPSQRIDELGVEVGVPPSYSIVQRGGAYWVTMNDARSVRLDTQGSVGTIDVEIRRLPRGSEVTEQGALPQGGFYFRWERTVGGTSIRGHHAFSLVPTPGRAHDAVTCSGTQRGDRERLQELLTICQSLRAF